MIKATKTKTYDTEKSEIVKKVTCGVYGDPKGFETTMYKTMEGDFFLYTYGGKESPYPTEKITTFTKAKAQEWLKNN